jgi:hypothetical protein
MPPRTLIEQVEFTLSWLLMQTQYFVQSVTTLRAQFEILSETESPDVMAGFQNRLDTYLDNVAQAMADYYADRYGQEWPKHIDLAHMPVDLADRVSLSLSHKFAAQS